MLREAILRGRSAFLLLLVLALVACGGDSGPPEEGSGNGRPSEQRESAGRSGRAQEAATKSVEAGATMPRMEITGEMTKPQESESGSGDRGAGSVPSDTLAAGAIDATGGPLARGRMVSY